MTNFYLRCSCIVKGRLEALVAHHQVTAGKEGHDGALADSGIADHQHALGSLLVDRDGRETVVDQGFELLQVDWV